MSASQEISGIKRLGIIAGGGSLPGTLLSYCDHNGITPFIIAINGQTPPDLLINREALWVNWGNAQKIINFFKSNNVEDLVLIGNVTRPSLKEIKPDWKAIKILSKLGTGALGDNTLLEAIRDTLKGEGFHLHGFHEFLTELVAPKGTLTHTEPTKEELHTIKVGFEASQALGALDIGQSVIAQEQIIIGVEAVEGTNALIQRCRDLIKPSSKAILVKSCKPQQDERLDMPTIGIDTIRYAKDCNIKGIAIQSEKVLLAQVENLVEIADEYNIFIYGI